MIVPEEAKTVKLIYDLYLEGNSIVVIRRELEKRSIPSPTGKKGWCARAIDTLLSNEKYRGNSTATAPLTSYETKSTQRSRYMYSKHHIAIIDDAQFEAVAEEKKRRSNIECDETGVHRKSTRYTVKITKLITRTEASETFLGVIGMNLSTHNSLHLSSPFFAKRSNKHFTPRFLHSLTIYPLRSNDIIRTQCSLLLRGVQIWAENGILSRLTAFLSVCLNSLIFRTCACITQTCRLSP